MLKYILNRIVKKGQSQKISEAGGMSLYRTSDNLYFWLDPDKYLHKSIIEKGSFEKTSTELVKRLIKPGDIVLDVGANIGYYTIIMSKLVGEHGKVLAFEPTDYYRSILLKNLSENTARNVTVFPIGLSDHQDRTEISIGNSSATLHWTSSFPPVSQEIIEMNALDNISESLGINRLDFIKVDVDGHEPFFLKGARHTIEKFKPVILLEINHENYLKAGITAWDFYNDIKSKGFHVYSERSTAEYPDMFSYLRECGNFAYSANVIISMEEISHRLTSR